VDTSEDDIDVAVEALRAITQSARSPEPLRTIA
jgi:hypothetical protein